MTIKDVIQQALDQAHANDPSFSYPPLILHSLSENDLSPDVMESILSPRWAEAFWGKDKWEENYKRLLECNVMVFMTMNLLRVSLMENRFSALEDRMDKLEAQQSE